MFEAVTAALPPTYQYHRTLRIERSLFVFIASLLLSLSLFRSLSRVASLPFSPDVVRRVSFPFYGA